MKVGDRVCSFFDSDNIGDWEVFFVDLRNNSVYYRRYYQFMCVRQYVNFANQEDYGIITGLYEDELDSLGLLEFFLIHELDGGLLFSPLIDSDNFKDIVGDMLVCLKRKINLDKLC